MLTVEKDKPNGALAAYVDTFLKEAPWLRRRVETVSFLDVDTVIRRTTLDVGITEVLAATGTCPLYPARPLVPLAMMQKDLLVDFDLRDRHGGALAVAPRDVDSFFAWSALCEQASKILGVELGTTGSLGALTRHLSAIAFAFPHPSDHPYSETLASWEPPANWNDSEHRSWRQLLDDEAFSRLLRDFTFNFILMTQLETDSALQLVKFAYRQYLPYSELLKRERLGLIAAQLAVDAPSVGWARSYHLRVEAPQDLVLTDVGLFRVERESGPIRRAAHSYEVHLAAEFAQVYTTSSIVPANHAVAVAMRVPIIGYLRAMWLTSVAIATVLTCAGFMIERVEAAITARADAAVALLLVAPSLLAAYLVRPGEHAIASRLLRPLRYGIGLTGSLTYVAAALLVLEFEQPILGRIWAGLAVTASVVALAITLVLVLTKRDLDEGTRTANTTERRTIVVMPKDDG